MSVKDLMETNKKTLWLVGMVLFALMGLFLAWQLAQYFMSSGQGDRVEADRAHAAQFLEKRVASMQEKMNELFQDKGWLHASNNKDMAQASELAGLLLPDAQNVALYQSDLNKMFAGGAEKVGFSRLDVLVKALAEGEQVATSVYRDEKDEWSLLLAKKAPSDQTLEAVVLAEYPLNDLLSDTGSDFNNELRLMYAGEYVGRGNVRSSVGSSPVKGTSFQVVNGSVEKATLRYGLFGHALLTLLALGLAGYSWTRHKALNHAVQKQEADYVGFDALEEAPKVEPAKPVSPLNPVVKPDDAQESSVVVDDWDKMSAELGAEVPMITEVDPNIFRAYDIRGVVGAGLDEHVARAIGAAVGSAVKEADGMHVVVGRDGRLSGPELSEALIQGILSTGCHVIDIGMAPTPVVYFAAKHWNLGSCVAVTGSHNPPDYNGFKIVVEGETLSGEGIQALRQRIVSQDYASDDGEPGQRSNKDATDEYIDRVASDVQLVEPLKVVVDSGNGVAGLLAEPLLTAVGCEVVPLFCDVDGTFPNHHPDPSDPENLKDLAAMVKHAEADIGLAFDGDGDRLGVVTKEGKMIFSDRVLMLFARDVLSRNPGANIIFDVKCTGHLTPWVLRHGGSPTMWKTGHSLIKSKMKETGAELAGEMSGHFFFSERWYGFDDGLYSAARLMEILAESGQSPSQVFDELPDSVSTPELKIKTEEGQNYAFVKKFQEEAKFPEANLNMIDGVRADWPDGWGLVRSSNTTPSLVLRFDADTPEALARIQEAFRQQITAIEPSFTLPF